MEENFIDVEFNAYDSSLAKDNNGTPMYYSCKQVSSVLQESESTVRFWCKSFEDILNIEVINAQKKYKLEDINNLLFIKKLLREDNMSIKQVNEYFKKNGLQQPKGLLDIESPSEMKVVMRALKEDMNLKIEDITTRILVKQQEMFDNMQENILNKQQEMMSNLLSEITSRNDIAIEGSTINFERVLNEKVNLLGKDSREVLEAIVELNRDITSMSDDLVAIKIENQKIHDLQLKLEDRKKEYENKKGFFKKLFSR